MTRSVARVVGATLMVGWIVASGRTPGHARATQAQTPQARPNVVVIMADDLDLGMFSRLEELGAVPNLKAQLLDRGTTFTNMFVTNSLCCPSRATFLTGQYSHNHGVRVNDAPDGGVTRFDDRSTLATWLHDAGYRTGYIGKYLNGYGQADVTKDGQVTLADRQYIPPGWTDWQALLDYSTYNVYDYQLNDNGVIAAYGHAEADYQTDVLASRAAGFIQESARPENQAAPFFLFVTPLAPHLEVFAWTPSQSPWQWDIRPAPRHDGTLPVPLPRPVSFNERDVSDKPAWVRLYRPPMTGMDIAGVTRQYRHRLESMRAVDDLVGSVVAALDAAGELEHTVIMFTSDNGFLHGEHRMSQKLVAYEEAIRVPLIVRLPGGSAQNISHLVLNNDLAPTIAELAGVAPGLAVDGTSFMPLLRQSIDHWRRRFLIEHWQADVVPKFNIPTYAAVRSKDTSASGDEDLLYVQYADPMYTSEFYDVRSDRYQVNSLPAGIGALFPMLRQSLKSSIAGLTTCQDQGCRMLEFAAVPNATAPLSILSDPGEHPFGASVNPAINPARW